MGRVCAGMDVMCGMRRRHAVLLCAPSRCAYVDGYIRQRLGVHMSPEGRTGGSPGLGMCWAQCSDAQEACCALRMHSGVGWGTV